MADLKQAKKNRDNAAVRASKKEAQKAKKEQEKAASVAMKAKQQQQKVSPTVPVTQKKIFHAFTLPPDLFVRVETFDNEEEFKAYHRNTVMQIGHTSLPMPALIKDAGTLRDLITKYPRAASQVASFEEMFPKTPAAKSTGRVQTAFSKAELAEPFAHHMSELLHSIALRPAAEDSGLSLRT